MAFCKLSQKLIKVRFQCSHALSASVVFGTAWKRSERRYFTVLVYKVKMKVVVTGELKLANCSCFKEALDL